MNSTEFIALLLLATAMSFTPGPNTALSSAMAANHGLRRAMPFVCAVPLGWGLLLTFSALGIGALLVALPWLAWAVKLTGAAYLVWLARRLAATEELSEADARELQIGFWQGAALQLVNIKAWMLALALVSGWVAGHDNAGWRFAIVLPVMLAFAFASNLAYALVGSLLRDWLAGPDGTRQRLRWFNRVMAAVLVLTAGWLLLRH
ncbi:MAG: threonine/homoserine/homoserine lactone efflux protein [Polaromonas sp.]|jgi:threonine/homoserine/homoserine lactone efflux protein